MQENKISNNQSVVYIYQDTVRKRYFDKRRHLKEYKTLVEANDFYKSFYKNGWAYEIVKVLSATEQEGIVMKKVKGLPMRDDPQFNEECFYHAGCWLGNFHQLTLKQGVVQSFSDFGLPNLMICKDSKTITGIDLGEGALKLRSYYYDMLHFLLGTITSHISRKTLYNSQCVREFLKGYNKCSTFKYSDKLFKENLDLVMKRWSNPKRKKRIGKIKFYTGKLILFYYVYFNLKKTLKNM